MVAAPVGVQLSRAKGWRMPPNTIRVARPGKWGSPFPVKDLTWVAVALGFRADLAGRTACAVELYRRWLGLEPRPGPLAKDEGSAASVIEYENGACSTVGEVARGIGSFMAAAHPIKVPKPPTHEEIQRELGGKNLACWCHLGTPCHREVLLEIANKEPAS